MIFPYALEKLRTIALARQDAPQYARLCDETGISPEDEFLYDKGREIFQAPVRKKTKGEPFIVDADLNLSPDTIANFTSGIDEKVRILQKYFSGRFGRNASQDLRKYDDAGVGALFNRLYTGYKARNN
ncbi:MAG: hypothetical protein AABW88_01070 [Nanoarchaeota archaeon]